MADDLFMIRNYLAMHGARGKLNRIGKEELINAFGFHSVRQLQKVVSDERQRGAIICSGGIAGYWLPGSRAELEEHTRGMKARANSILQSVEAAERELDEIPGQMHIEVK